MANREEWLEERSKGIGGSDIGAIMGLNKFATPLQIYYDKIGQGDDVSNPQMETGNVLERFVGEWFADYNELQYCHSRKHRLKKDGINPKTAVYLPNKRLVTSKDEPIFKASQDYGYEDNGVMEAKSTIGDTEEPLSSWYAQGQWYLGVTKMPKLTIAWVTLPWGFDYDTFLSQEWKDIKCLRSVLKYRQEEFFADYDFIHQAQQHALRFWHDHVLPQIPPKPINDNDLKLLYPVANKGQQVEAVAETYKAWQQLCTVRFLKKEYTDRETSLKTQMKMVLKDAEILSYGDKVLVTHKSTDTRRVDTQRLKDEGLYDEYSKVTTGRKMLIKK